MQRERESISGNSPRRKSAAEVKLLGATELRSVDRNNLIARPAARPWLLLRLRETPWPPNN